MIRAGCFAIPTQRKRVLMTKTNPHAQVADELPWSDGITEGIVKLTDYRLFSAFLHETKPLKLRKVAIDNLRRFRSESD